MSTDAPIIEDENRSAATAFAGEARYVASPAIAARPGFVSAMPWTMLLIIVGLATVAACVFIPLREENRQLETDLTNLRTQSKYVSDQVAANASFLERIHSDPTLSHRLMMRMTRKPIPGTAFLEHDQGKAFGSSPFEITRVDLPAAPVAYQSDLPLPVRALFVDIRSRAILLCAGIFLLATAVVLGPKTVAKRKTPTLA